MSPGRRNFSLKSARIPAKKLLASGQNPSLLDTLLFFKQALKPEQRKQIKTFVARLFGLSSYEAAKNLAYDFGIGPDKPPVAAALGRPEYLPAHSFRRDSLYCQRVLCGYLHLLEGWKVRYSPVHPEEIGVPHRNKWF